jgi:hypothetical protein
VSARFLDVDGYGLPPDAWQRLAATAGALIVTGVEQRPASLNFNVVALPEAPGEAARAKVREGCEALFASLVMWRCSVCQRIVTNRSDSLCVHSFHPGERIPYGGGRWTRKAVEDGSPAEYEQWSCCGEQPAGTVGCEEVVTDGHSPLNESQVLSRFELSVIA